MIDRVIDRLHDVFPPRARVAGALILLVVSLIAWPVSQLTVAKSEPPFVLGLSWLAIIVTCIDVIATTDVRREQDESE